MRSINKVLSDLKFSDISIEQNESIHKLIKIFEQNMVPAVMITIDGNYKTIISRARFYEYMAKQFIYELFRKRTIASFTEIYDDKETLILSGDTPIVIAANEALLRNEKFRYEPIIVKTTNGQYRVLDLFQLLIAQTELHLLTLDFLKEANEFKKEVIGIAAHDLRNPLNAIMGFTNIIEENAGDSKIFEFTSMINEMVLQMDALVSELLNSAADDLTEISLEKKGFDLLELLQHIHNGFIPTAAKKNQQIRFENKNGTGTFIKADRNKLREVFENLISNAIKYSETKKEIFIRLKHDYDFFVIEIEDEGLGFTKDDLTKIFGKFQRLSSRPTGNETSNGLGLYIVKKIIDLHKGKIEVRSEKNKGSLFAVHIPRG